MLAQLFESYNEVDLSVTNPKKPDERGPRNIKKFHIIKMKFKKYQGIFNKLAASIDEIILIKNLR